MTTYRMREIALMVFVLAQIPICWLGHATDQMIERELWLFGAFNAFCLGFHAGRWWSHDA